MIWLRRKRFSMRASRSLTDVSLQPNILPAVSAWPLVYLSLVRQLPQWRDIAVVQADSTPSASLFPFLHFTLSSAASK